MSGTIRPVLLAAALCLALIAAAAAAVADCVDYANHARWLARHEPPPDGGADYLAARDSLVFAIRTKTLNVFRAGASGAMTPLATLNFESRLGHAFLAGDWLYLTSQLEPGKLYIVDVADPAAPILADSLILGFLVDCAAAGGTTLFATVMDSLVSIDISTPGAPAVLDTLPLGEYCNGMAWDGGMLYLTDCLETLDIVDATDPSALARRGTIAVDEVWDPFGVAVAGGYAYIGNECEHDEIPLAVVNVSNPDGPTLAGVWNLPEDWCAVEGPYFAGLVSGRLWLGCDWEDDLDDFDGALVFDITAPAAPELLYAMPFYSPVKAMAPAWEEGLWHVAMGGHGYWLLDLRGGEPAEPVGQLAGFDANDVAVTPFRAFVTGLDGNLRVVNIEDPAHPSQTDAQGIGEACRGIDLVGDRAYLCGGTTGLWILDVSAPDMGIGVYSSLPMDYAFDVAVADTLAYVTDPTAGLCVISVDDPAHPFLVGTADTPVDARGLALYADTLALVADRTGGLRVIDVSDPAAPSEIAFVDGIGDARAVAVKGDVAYMACTGEGIRLVDLADPGNPALLPARVWTTYYAMNVAVCGDYLYASDGEAGLFVFDVTDPRAPVPAGLALSRTDCGGSYTQQGLAVVPGKYVYMADGEAGLVIFGRQCDETPVALACFQVLPTAGAVSLRWELAAGSADCEQRLTAHGLGGARELAIREPAPGLFEAVDASPLLAAGGSVRYELHAREAGGDWTLLRAETVTLAPQAAAAARLVGAHPNPFNPATTVVFELGEAAPGRLAIYDVAGRRVAILAEGILAAGRNAVDWDGRDASGREMTSGVYFARLETPGGGQARRLVLLR
ncbi:MAG: T9SS type A sorting domain-containing protein [Candidatus Krumholzibacteriota bacterium]|nr:T9SS type A sorting domain-containing protein [Candidatus Krumholzibacteriota bacterium]